MIDPATIAAACGGFLAGWACRTALERRQAAIALRAKARALANPPYSSAAIAWQRQHLIRAEGFRIPPEQPLAADLIRYWRWRDEQVRQALDEETNPPRRPRD